MELSEMMKEFRLNTLEDNLKVLFPATEFSFEELLGKLLQGDLFRVIQVIFSSIKEYLAGDYNGIRQVFLTLLFMGMVSAALGHITGLFEKYNLGEVTFSFVYLLQAAFVIRTYLRLLQIAEAGIERIIVFVKMLMPSYLLLVGISAGNATAGIGYQVILFLIYGVEELFLGMLLPCISGIMLLTVLEGLWDRTENLLELLKKIVGWIIKGAFGAVCGMELLQALLTPAVDGISNSAVKRIVSSIPGVGSGAENVMELALGTAVVIKNSVGILLLLFLLYLCVPPILKILTAAFAFKAGAALVGLVCDKRLSRAVDQSADAIFLLGKVVGTAMLFFGIAIAVAAGSIRVG